MICYDVSKRLMISAGESSGELYGALLSKEVKKMWPDVEIFGIGGSRMKSEGVTLIAQTTNVIGITEAISHIGEVRRNLKKASEALTKEKPDILVLIDYPDFNLALAKKAKKAGIPVLYYACPQVWAWRKGRVKKIASLVKRIALLFPFEVDYYRDTGLPCEFVGHPIVETIDGALHGSAAIDINRTKEELKQDLCLKPQRPVITLLPGSRPAEIRKHLPLLKGVAAKIHETMPEFQTVIPLANDSEITERLEDYIRVIKGDTTKAVACSEASAIASGTATIEAALLGTPMVVFYKVSPLTFLLARLLVKVKYISLVNLISQRDVVVELIQKDATPDNIFSELKRIIHNPSYRNNMVSQLDKIRKTMTGKRASYRVAQIIRETAGWDNTSAC